ncbi:MAG: hypothetical protein JKY76_05335, partial [Proteobacteria bacterium]|nr:hypothetical protein [Pseudomonadota bacterium]
MSLLDYAQQWSGDGKWNGISHGNRAIKMAFLLFYRHSRCYDADYFQFA